MFIPGYILFITCSFWVSFKLIKNKAQGLNTSQDPTTSNNFLLLALISVIAIFSIYTTGGKTIFLISIPLMALILPYSFPIVCRPDKKTVFKAGFYLFTSAAIFLYHYFFTPFIPDTVFWAKLSNSIVQEQKESIESLFNSYVDAIPMSPYHYGELYLTGIIKQITGLNELSVLLYFTYPLLHSLAAITLIEVLNCRIKSFEASAAIGFCLLYGLSPIALQYEINALKNIADYYYFGIPDFQSTKLLFIYPLIFQAIHHGLKKEWIAFNALISLITIVYTTTMVGFTGGILIVIIGITIKNLISGKLLSKEGLSKLFPFFIPLVTFQLFGLIYPHFNGSADDELNLKLYLQPINNYINNYQYYTIYFLKYISTPVTLFTLSTIGLITYFVKFRLSAINHLTIFLLGSLITGVIFTTVFHESKVNSQQALNNILSPVMISLSVLIVLAFRDIIAKPYYYSLFIVIGIFNIYSNSYKQISFHNQYGNLLANVEPVFNWAHINSQYSSAWIYSNEILKHPILQIKDTRIPIDISPIFLPSDSLNLYCRKNIKSPVCYFWEEKNKMEFPLNEFFKKFKLKYLYIDPKVNINHTLTDFLDSHATYKGYNLWKIDTSFEIE
jgi:hypothetical protein